MLGIIHEKSIIPNSNHSELYFEEANIEKFVTRLEMLYPETEYVNRLMTHNRGTRWSDSMPLTEI